MSKLPYKNSAMKTFQSDHVTFGKHGLLYNFDHYFVVFNENELNNCLVFISNDLKESLTLSGKCEMEIFYGSLKINGVEFKAPFKNKIYSPLSHAKVSLETLKVSDKMSYNYEELFGLFEINKFDAEDLDDFKNQIIKVRNISTLDNFTILKLSSFFCLTTEDIIQFKEYKKLFDVDIRFPFAKKLQFSLTEESATYVITREMKETIENITKLRQEDNELSIALAGPKNAGKSSFLRTLTNKLLTQGYEEICIIDGDPGQSEFSTCGSISLTIVSNPLLGPPFTHRFNPGVRIVEQVFLGTLSPNDDPKYYCRCFERLYHIYLSLSSGKRMPLIINTMGWVQGLGLLLLAFKLLLANPTHIVQLKKGKENQDVGDITPELLENLIRSSNLFKNFRPTLTSAIHVVRSPVSQATAQCEMQLKPQAHRDLTILSYIFHETENRPLCFPDSLPSDYNQNPVTRLRCRIPEALTIIHQSNGIKSVEYSSVRLKLVYSDESEFDQLDYLMECFILQWVGICRPAPQANYRSVIERSPYTNCSKNENELMICLGMGLVSHIRKQNYELDLLTGVDSTLLDGSHLVMGKIYPPECIFLNQREITCKHNNINLPFISPMITVGVGRTAIATRKSLPKIRRLHHN